jgi:(1->4)-alpha-D-glucan 1-alpha-D-glucosylmutase
LTINTVPRATARLQLHRSFTLDHAADVVPYLASLGISHVYSSPLLTARAGSTHGYDIVDHHAINPELGGEPALRRLVASLRAHDMGLIVDIVPNHMGVGGSDNAWWLDVLEWGRASPYSNFFDIDWDPPDAFMRDRILVPFLGAPYGACLDNAEISLRFDYKAGTLSAVYHEHLFPIAPRQYRRVFGSLECLASNAPFGNRGTRATADVMKAALADYAASPSGASSITESLSRFDPTGLEGRQRLHELLERQHYRLAWWRAAADEINWRRFFDVTSLAGLRAEMPRVFDETHAFILKLYADGLIDGLRIDHIDGLADPRAYCRKLRRRMEAAAAMRPAGAPAGAPYIIVEKILASFERLPTDWHTDGTTGYDFMDQVCALFHAPDGEAPLSALWVALTGNEHTYEAEERLARRLVLRDLLSSELNATAAALHRIARADRRTRDYTLTAIRRALTEILVHFPVYRLYTGLVGRPKTDDHVLARAIAGARRSMRAVEQDLLRRIDVWLGGESPRVLPRGAVRRQRLQAIVRFEQLSAPVAAKSAEDTAFYRYGRLISRNEVGSNPGQFALSVSAFHSACANRAQSYPSALLATATHDHKRGEDLRARLAVLSEIPDEWGALVTRWMRLNARLRREVDGGFAPDATDEFILYQMLVGAWPPGLTGSDSAGIQLFADRIVAWQEKALREAKRHTAWIAQDDEYEAACREFVYRILLTPRESRWVDEVASFADSRIGPLGAMNGLGQTLLRLTAPGVPDLYQGCELWDLSMVDPDNRRPVDFEQRRTMLATIRGQSGMPEFQNWQDGRIKLAIIARTLALRARLPDLFARGAYVPFSIDGPASEHVVSYGRQLGDRRVMVAAIRMPGKLFDSLDPTDVRSAPWQQTRILLPRGWASRPARDVLSDSDTFSTRLPMASELFAHLPIALYEMT